jgi:staphylococcal nuclease domain-containing protein 1
MSGPAQAQPVPGLKKGIVKQVLSGDSVIIRGQPKNGPPAEKQINFSNVIAPKLARRPTNPNDDSKDEPWAWEAREFLRQKLIGEEVYFFAERPPNATREYGYVLLGKDPSTAINITELIVSEGLVSVRSEGIRQPSAELQRLIELENQAKAAGKGKYSGSPSAEHVRNIVWQVETPSKFVDLQNGKPVKAIIEHVRDGSTVRAFLLPGFQYITLMISGIRCPGFKLDQDGRPDPSVVVPFAEEARYFVESRLLQRDVEILLESVNNNNFVGTIMFPKGNIAEALLREGFAHCVDWSMAFMKSGADKLRAAERVAKANRVRLWKDYQPQQPTYSGKEKDFSGTVVEVYNGDAISVKTASGQIKKAFLSSIRPPRDSTVKEIDDETKKPPPRAKNAKPLYDVPWLFEAREFLRKKLIGKTVKCTLDYVSPARDNFPEKFCYTVTIGGSNVAEALVNKGLATVIRYRQTDDQRSSRYDELLAAETQAIKGLKGVHAKKDIPHHRINDLTTDQHSKIKHQYLPSWQRALRTEALVEFVASGSRFRLYIPKESCLVTFLLGGITCPRSSRPAINNQPAQEAEPWGEEAYNFVRDRILQRDVSVHIETTDKAGAAVIGWLWYDTNINLSVQLVEEGLAQVHFTAEKSEHYRALKAAEDNAKKAKKGLWSNYTEPVTVVETEKSAADKEDDEVDEKTQPDRKMNFENVVVTEVTADLHFFAQHADNGPKLEALMKKLRQDFQVAPPVAGAYNPKRNDLCAAKFSEDEEWYRARVERVQGTNATIKYIDYGNSETVPTTRLAVLPPAFVSDKPYATEYVLAWTKLPVDEDDKREAYRAFAGDVLNNTLLLNVEYNANNLTYATLHDPKTKADLGKGLVADGFIIAEKKAPRRFNKIIEDYKEAEQAARKSHIGIWEYGDITEDPSEPTY